MRNIPVMTPSNSAVVTVDLHRGHLDPAVATMPLPPDRCEALLQRLNQALQAFREAGVLVIHVVTEYRSAREKSRSSLWASHQGKTRSNAREHNIAGSPGVQVMPEVLAEGDSIVMGKKRYSAFFHTDLELLLRSNGIDMILLAGVNTNSCVLATAFDAVNRDFPVTVLEDCVDSMDGDDAHEKALEMIRLCLGRIATSTEIARELATDKS